MSWQSTLVVMAGTLALVGATARAAGAEEVDAEAEAKNFQGTWILVSSESDGKAAVSAEELKERKVRMIFEKDEVLATMGEKVVSLGTFKLDPAKSPHWYDRTYTDGTPRRGIYRLEGDTLTICLAGLDKDRPTTFGTAKNDGHSLLVYQREKK